MTHYGWCLLKKPTTREQRLCVTELLHVLNTGFVWISKHQIPRIMSHQSRSKVRHRFPFGSKSVNLHGWHTQTCRGVAHLHLMMITGLSYSEQWTHHHANKQKGLDLIKRWYLKLYRHLMTTNDRKYKMTSCRVKWLSSPTSYEQSQGCSLSQSQSDAERCSGLHVNLFKIYLKH